MPTRARRLLASVAAGCLLLSGCGDSGPNEDTLALCAAVPDALASMDAMREGLTGDGFARNVHTVVQRTYDEVFPVFELASRAADPDEEGEYSSIGAAVRTGWFAYVNMDTVDQRAGYEAYAEAIQGLYRADRACSELPVA